VKRCGVCHKKGNWTLRKGVFNRLYLCQQCADKLIIFLEKLRRS
jgi:hypothetical protein